MRRWIRLVRHRGRGGNSIAVKLVADGIGPRPFLRAAFPARLQSKTDLFPDGVCSPSWMQSLEVGMDVLSGTICRSSAKTKSGHWLGQKQALSGRLYRLMLAQESGEWGGIERPGKSKLKLPEDEVASYLVFKALQWAQESHQRRVRKKLSVVSYSSCQ